MHLLPSSIMHLLQPGMIAISELPGALEGLGADHLVDAATGRPTCPPRQVQAGSAGVVWISCGAGSSVASTCCPGRRQSGCQLFFFHGTMVWSGSNLAAALLCHVLQFLL